MAIETTALFAEDAYRDSADATVIAITDGGGIVLDRTCFYATSGGQPGDTGTLTRTDGTQIPIDTTVKGDDTAQIVHLPAAGATLPRIGETLALKIDWERRHLLMRMHSACHLLSVVCPFPITGAAISETSSRVDFDMTETVDKGAVTERLMALVDADHPIYTQWITEAALAADRGLVRSKNVRPPAGAGRIRLVCIGDNAAIDSQPCGGTHVRSTAEVGAIHIGKIEKKGRENRRFRIRFGHAPR